MKLINWSMIFALVLLLIILVSVFVGWFLPTSFTGRLLISIDALAFAILFFGRLQKRR
ncbi:hypothetical protein [Paenibacillus sp. FSL P4-0288]|uniref:hypothetical protein n=1 Tax=Paenibacillus sp. FSL P4-0288 TaxID=2921633 RepID=UPI0030F82E74